MTVVGIVVLIAAALFCGGTCYVNMIIHDARKDAEEQDNG